MSLEETIEATLDPNGELHLTHQPQLPPGPVLVTIRPATAASGKNGLAEVVQQLVSEQHSRGQAGRPTSEILTDQLELQAEDTARDARLEAARRKASPGGA